MSNGEVAKIPGVVQFFQQDAGFASSLVESIMDMYPEKVEAGEPVNILQVQQGAGYNSPFDRRQIGYQPYEDEGKIKTVERIAPIDDQNATSSMRDVTAATLPKYGEGELMESGAAMMHMRREYIRHWLRQIQIFQWYQ